MRQMSRMLSVYKIAMGLTNPIALFSICLRYLLLRRRQAPWPTRKAMAERPTMVQVVFSRSRLGKLAENERIAALGKLDMAQERHTQQDLVRG